MSVFTENCECLCLRRSHIFFWSKLYFSLDSVKYFTASWELPTKAEIGKCHIFCSCTLSILFRDWRHCLGLYHFNFNNRLEPSLSAYVSWINTEWCEVFLSCPRILTQRSHNVLLLGSKHFTFLFARVPETHFLNKHFTHCRS